MSSSEDNISSPVVDPFIPRARRKSSLIEDYIPKEVTDFLDPIELNEPDVIELGEKMERKKLKALKQYLAKVKDMSNLKGMIEDLNFKELKVKLDAYTQTSKYAREADKVYYLIGCIITFLTIYILGKYPGTLYFYWLLFLEVGLFCKRFHLYHQLNWQYYLVDFCYYCNTIMLLYIFVFPHSRILALFCHFVSYGVLGFALFQFKNSFIFHHMDKLTDLVIHLLPLVTIWNINWNLKGTQEFKDWGFIDLSSISFDFSFVKEIFYLANTMYALHAIIYYSLILIVWRKSIFEGDKDCLLKATTLKNKTAMRLHKNYGLWARCLFFFINHYLYAVFLCILGFPSFFFEYLSFGQMHLYIIIVLKNGAEYYFDYFSRKYENNLKQLDNIDRTE